MNYQETLDYLYNMLPMFQKIGPSAYKKDLANTILFCNHLDNPHKKFKSVHVAGTNGKGSTAHTIAAILQSAGYKTGLYTSPHLKSFTERIKINGVPIGEQDVVEFTAANKAFIEEIKPSFFEMTVAMAFEYFHKQNVDIAIVEVGMGGKFDSTNIVTPILSLITNIGYDHQNFLGETLPEIAGEKAGIIKQGIPVVVSERQPQVEKVFIDKAGEVNAALYFASDYYNIIESQGLGLSLNFDVYQEEKRLYADMSFQIGGKYQLKNIGGILKAVELLREMDYQIHFEDIKKGFEQVKTLTGLKGRWEILNRQPLIICDTAHNEDGIHNIVQQLATIKYHKLHFVLGVVNDKKPDKVLKILPKSAFYYFTQAKIPRAMDANDLSRIAGSFGLAGEVVPDVNKAIDFAKSKASENDLIFIGGSIFVVAEIEGL